MEIDQQQAIEEVKKGTEIGKAIVRIEREAAVLSLKYLQEKYFGKNDELQPDKDKE